MNYHKGLKFVVNHEDGAVFSIEIVDVLPGKKYNCRWVVLKKDAAADVDDTGYITYYDTDMNGWIDEGKWNITIERTNLLPEGLFEL